jgi:hypothetical protein
MRKVYLSLLGPVKLGRLNAAFLKYRRNPTKLPCEIYLTELKVVVPVVIDTQDSRNN